MKTAPSRRRSPITKKDSLLRAKCFENKNDLQRNLDRKMINSMLGGVGEGRGGGMKASDETCPNLSYKGNLPEPTRQFQPRTS